MLKKETKHPPCSVRPARIGAGRTASQPRVTSAVNVPMLGDDQPARVRHDSAGVGLPLRYESFDHLDFGSWRFAALFEDALAVGRMHSRVAIAVENVGWL